MKLIYSPASPFVRKVSVLIHELDLNDKVVLAPVSTTALNPSTDARAANPLGKIPALVLDDGPTLIDSRVICRYLNDLVGAPFYPADRLWDVLTLEALTDGIMEAAVSMVYETRLRPEALQSSEWIEAQWDKVSHALAALEISVFRAQTGPLNMAQLALACALGYLDFRHEARNWRQAHPRLADWYKGVESRPSLRASTPIN